MNALVSRKLHRSNFSRLSAINGLAFTNRLHTGKQSRNNMTCCSANARCFKRSSGVTMKSQLVKNRDADDKWI